MRHSLRIGLSARLMHRVPAELGFRNKTLQYIEQSLAHWVIAHGALALMVPTMETGGEIQRRQIKVSDYVREIDGLILQGGLDVSPVSYGEEPLKPEWSGDRVRDLYELDLFWECLIQGKPVLGICRGCQLINVALGGSLFQDLPSQYPDLALHNDVDLYDGLSHAVRFAPDGLLARLYPDRLEVQVSSIHHQAVKRLGNDLDVEARAEPDGVIEAIRWRGNGFVLGVQWHPEFHAPQDTTLLPSEPLMEAFLEAARTQRAP
jgi:putative glutamine amidotransferase